MVGTEVDARTAQLAVLPDPSGLLRAIMLEPGEDTIRLAYADWLDEQESAPVRCLDCNGTGMVHDFFGLSFAGCATCSGRGEVRDETNRMRAELVRVQDRIDLHYRASERLSKSEPYPHGMLLFSKRQELLSRERHLCEWAARRALGVEWGAVTTENKSRGAVSVPVGWHNITLAFARGFIGGVECPWAWWVENGDKVRAQEWIPRVKLTTAPAVDRFVADYGADGVVVILVGKKITVPFIHPQTPTWEAAWQGALSIRYPGTAFELPD